MTASAPSTPANSPPAWRSITSPSSTTKSSKAATPPARISKKMPAPGLRCTPTSRASWWIDMDKSFEPKHYPSLEKDDAGLLSDIQAILSVRALGDPYSEDGAFALNLASLPPGLRAMAATHWLDISLTLDSITWHFGNFGEPYLVAETEAGLQELGLHELAICF